MVIQECIWSLLNFEHPIFCRYLQFQMRFTRTICKQIHTFFSLSPLFLTHSRLVICARELESSLVGLSIDGSKRTNDLGWLITACDSKAESSLDLKTHSGQHRKLKESVKKVFYHPLLEIDKIYNTLCGEIKAWWNTFFSFHWEASQIQDI